MEDKDDLAVVEREELSRHKQSFDIRKAAAGLVDGAGSAMAGAVATGTESCRWRNACCNSDGR